MSIKSYVNELKTLNVEIKRVSTHLRNLRKKSKEMEEHIELYLIEKDQPGLQHNGTAIIVESKPKRISKKKLEAEEDAIRILEYHGIDNPKSVLEEVLEARKGEQILCNKIKIKKIKK